MKTTKTTYETPMMNLMVLDPQDLLATSGGGNDLEPDMNE